MFELLVLIITVVWLAYKLWTVHYDYWERRGFPCIKASFPLGSHNGLGHMMQFQGTATEEVHKALAPHPYGGVIIVRRPYLFVRDPEIIRHIMVKDFAYFRDRPTADNMHEPESHHIFNTAGEEWRVKRVHLGPIFSAGKMKSIFKLYESIGPDLFAVLDSKQDSPIDAKDTYSRFTIDFIGSWAFGGRVDSLKDPQHFLKRLGPTMFPVISPKTILKLSTYNVIPQYHKFGSFAYLPPELNVAVSEAVSSALKARQESGASKFDLIDILLKMKNKGTLTTDKTQLDGNTVTEIKFDIKETDLSAEALILFTAGFDTTSTMISVILWELINNPSLQEDLRNEIDEKISAHEGLTYEALQSMDLLDRVVSEGNRKYAVVPILTRTCVRDYKMPDREDLVVEEGTRVILPLWAIHRDPTLYPDPLRFDPDRFLPHRLPPPGAYFPFGDGPHYCIGKRIGLIQVKMGLALTLSRYVVEKCSTTPEALEFAPTMLVLTSKTPYWMKIVRRGDGGCLDEQAKYTIPTSS